MKTATALTIVAIGAILAFAVTAQPSFFSFHVAGWVLMLTGLAGAAVPRRGYGWLRRRLVLNNGGQRKEIDLRQQNFSRLLVPGGLITEERGTACDGRCTGRERHHRAVHRGVTQANSGRGAKVCAAAARGDKLHQRCLRRRHALTPVMA